MLRRALSNLLDNAIKFSQPGQRSYINHKVIPIARIKSRG